MREILFRGKRTDNGEWVEGCLVHRSMFYGEPCDNYFILCDGEFHCDYYNASEVIPETIGQYTGLTDKNGNKIFEGDIVRVDDTENAVVEYDETSAFYMVVFDRAESDFGSLIEQYPNVEIIGNIHDNPELLKEREQNG